MKDLLGRKLSEEEARRILKRKAIPKKGYAAPPGTGPEGEKCKTCRHIYRKKMSKTYIKCLLNRDNWTGGAGSDVLSNAPACRLWEPKQ